MNAISLPTEYDEPTTVIWMEMLFQAVINVTLFSRVLQRTSNKYQSSQHEEAIKMAKESREIISPVVLFGCRRTEVFCHNVVSDIGST